MMELDKVLKQIEESRNDFKQKKYETFENADDFLRDLNKIKKYPPSEVGL